MNGAQTDLWASLDAGSQVKDQDDRTALHTAAGVPVGTATSASSSSTDAMVSPTSTPSSGSARLQSFQADEDKEKEKEKAKEREKAKSKGKTCSRHRNSRRSSSGHRAQTRRSALVAEQTLQAVPDFVLSESSHTAPARTFVRRMDVVSGGYRWRAERRRDSTSAGAL